MNVLKGEKAKPKAKKIKLKSDKNKFSKNNKRKEKKEKKNHIFKNNTQLYREKCQTINWIITDIKITAA